MEKTMIAVAGLALALAATVGGRDAMAEAYESLPASEDGNRKALKCRNGVELALSPPRDGVIWVEGLGLEGRIEKESDSGTYRVSFDARVVLVADALPDALQAVCRHVRLVDGLRQRVRESAQPRFTGVDILVDRFDRRLL